MKLPAVLIVSACLVSVQCAIALGKENPASPPSDSTPVLVELFTSEGCSSCPPAEAAIQRLDAHQPIPGIQMIVLSEHITYFNHEGWKDLYSSQQLTDRQYDYAHALGLSDVFTPQILVDGTQELWDKNSQQAESLFHSAAEAAKTPVAIRSVSVDPNSSVLQAHIEVDGSAVRHNADIYAAIALDHASVNVLRGENKGQLLTHVAVVRVLKKIGKLKKGTKADLSEAIKLDPDMIHQPLRLVVFVQEPGPGRVIGAALQKIPGNTGQP